MGAFSLIRYFTAASLLVVALLAGVMAWVSSKTLGESLRDEAAQYGQDMARSLNRAIASEFLEPRGADLQGLDLRDPAELAAIDAIVRGRMEGLRVLTLLLFDRSGTVVYSNNADYIGYRSVGNRGIEAALQGRPTSHMEKAELEQEPDEQGDRLTPTHELLETYSPFYAFGAAGDDDPGTILGVIEIYQDGRPITVQVREGQRAILGQTAVIMSLLFALLFAIVWRGDQRIRQLADALASANRGLEERVHERTRESERARERLQALFDGITDGISVIGGDFSIQQSNSGIERMFAPSPAPRPARCHERYAGREEPCENCPALRTLTSHSSATQRYRWPTMTGERDVEITTFPFTTQQGEAAVIEVVRDVSERSELERQVIQAESLANLGSMAAGVAHEIRNPVGMITSSAQLLARAEGLSERDRELLSVVQDESARIERTVSEFVRFASPPRPSRAATDVAGLFGGLRSVLSPEAERLGIALEVHIQSDLPPIFVDAELLHRALANLILNAMQVQQPGGSVRVEAGFAEPKTVEIHVIDRGPGIREEDLDRVFQPFFSRRTGGTGLGLSIVQRSVAANGGTISVTSGSAGTQFTLCFRV